MDDDLFLKNMKGVKPFKKKKNKQINKIVIKNIKLQNKTEDKDQIREIIKKTPHTKKNLDISFGEINKDLKKGRVQIDRRLDLHGYTLLEAYERFKKEVIKTYNNNKRCILVVTGKGVRPSKVNSKEEEPKLFYGKIKNSIISWINEETLKNYILTYQSAGINHGGEGAIFVYLRKKKN